MISLVTRKSVLVSTQTEKMARGLKFRIYKEEVLYYHGGKSKGTTCVVDRDVTAYMVVDRVLRFPTE